jgi:bifunctional non-homologous end joining protein LigD
MKWDGVRAFVALAGGTIAMASRLGNDITDRYPEIAPLADALGLEAVLDGEVVALDEAGRPRFERIQGRMHATRPKALSLAETDPVVLMLFDVLRLDGQDLTPLPYAQRRELLERLALAGPAWQTPPAAAGGRRAAVAAASELGLEGVVAKRLDSLYLPGRRSTAWVKFKLERSQELVVGGWLPGEGRLTERLGSLLVGYYEESALRYGGRVGSGIDERTRDRLESVLARLRRGTCPFDPPPRERALIRANWAEPELVVQVRFREWTNAGRLRQPTFAGIRDDRRAKDVLREPTV